MRRFSRYTIYVLVTSIVLIYGYCAKTHTLGHIVHRYLCAKTGYEVTFEKLCIVPFGLTLKNLKINGIIEANKITFKTTPLRLLMFMTSSSDFISKVNISKLKIYLDKDAGNKRNNLILSRGNFFAKLPKHGIVICVDECVAVKNSKFLKIADVDILANHDKIIINSVMHASNIPIKFSSQFERKTKNIFNTSSVFVAKNKVDMYLRSEGTIDFSSLDVIQNVVIEKFLYNGFNLNTSSCFFSRTAENSNVNLTGMFGNFKLNYASDGVIEAKSNIDISKIHRNISGTVKLNFKGQYNDVANVELDITELAIYGFDCGNLRLLRRKDKNNYNVSSTPKTGKKIDIIYTDDGHQYKANFIIKNKIVGVISGNTETGKILVDMKDIHVSDIFLIPLVAKGDRGTISVSGFLDKALGRIDFKIKDLNLSDVNNADITGTLTRNNGTYILDVGKDGDIISLNAVIKNGKIISTELKFVGVGIANKYFNHNISGLLNGHVKYEQDLLTALDIKIFDGTICGSKFKKIEVNANADSKEINIKRFALIDYSGKVAVDMAGKFYLKDKNSTSSFYIDMNGININGVTLNGSVKFKGRLIGHNNIEGSINGSGITVAGVSLGNISADAVISNEKLEIFNVKSDTCVGASLLAKFKENKLSGYFEFKNVNICGIYPNVSGFLNFLVKFSGKLSDPDIEITASTINGKYLSKPFFISSELEYKNGIVNVNKVMFLVDETKIEAKGQYYKEGKFFFKISDLTENSINTFFNFKIPLKGNISSEGFLKVKNEKQRLKMFLTAETVYIENMKLNEVESDIEVSDNKITVSNASARILDSKIELDNGYFNIKDGKYGLNLSLINVHAGVVDIFGNVCLSGNVSSGQKGKFIYRGTVSLNNLWINKHKLSSCFDYVIKDKTLEFHKKVDTVDQYNFSGVVAFGDRISVKKLNISKDKVFLNLFADFSNGFINVGVDGSNINGRYITDILNLSPILIGNINISANLSGNVSNPRGNMSLTSTNGFFSKIPYDNLDVKVDYSNNFVHIKELSLFKRNEIHAFAHGKFPLWFDQTLSNEMKKKFVNISYEINDYKLRILEHLSGKYIWANAGKMFFKGSITGTCEKLDNDGQLSVTGGSFKFKDYFNKIKDVFVKISLVKNLAKIDKFNFRSGSGKVNVSGQLKLENFGCSGFDIRVATGEKGIPLRIPQLPISTFMILNSVLKNYSSGEPSFDIKIQGTPASPKISGRVVLNNTHFTFPGRPGNGSSLIHDNIELDLELATSKNTKFENYFFSALIDGSLSIKGYYDHPNVRGVVTTSDGKLINHFGVKFNVPMAKLEVVDDNKIYITAEYEKLVSSSKDKEPSIFIKRCKISELYDLISVSGQNVRQKNTNIGVENKLQKSTDKTLDGQSGLLNAVDKHFATPFVKTFVQKMGFNFFIDDFNFFIDDSDKNDNNKTDRSLLGFLSKANYSFEKNLMDRIAVGCSFSCAFNSGSIDVKFKLAENLFLVCGYNISKGNRDLDNSVISDKTTNDKTSYPKIAIQYSGRF
ncbi:MAG: hypothetical protein LBU29_02070 [Endomicrobium sp.]|jgi:hypothetical protein|nr:hypothetical protein [Endomicrobium sp.]